MAEKKTKKKMSVSTIRGIVCGVVVIVVAVGYFTHVGIGNLSSFGFDVFALLCPLGYLESLLASKVFVPRAFISFVAVVLLVIVLGRVFCSWICPMPFLQKFIPGFKKKDKKAKASEGVVADAATEGELAEGEEGEEGEAGQLSEVVVTAAGLDVESSDAAGVETVCAEGEDAVCAEVSAKAKKPNKFKLDSRFGVLLGALGSAAIFGFPVFCLICPVGLTFASVYFIMRLFAFGETTWAVIVLPLFLLIEVVFCRKWCSKICPLGALMSLISGANKTFRPTIDDSKCLTTSKGAACENCAKVCPEEINIRKPELSPTALNNCTKCHECSSHCPAQAISFPFLAKKDKTSASAEQTSD